MDILIFNNTGKMNTTVRTRQKKTWILIKWTKK
jgi:hypothetical protein